MQLSFPLVCGVWGRKLAESVDLSTNKENSGKNLECGLNYFVSVKHRVRSTSHVEFLLSSKLMLQQLKRHFLWIDGIKSRLLGLKDGPIKPPNTMLRSQEGGDS